MYKSEDDKDFHYCTAANPDEEKYITRTHIANYIKDVTIVVLSVLRVLYFIYVLICVCRATSKPFFKRPAFMNWLPILILITSVASLYFGASILTVTVQGDGKVVCEIAKADLYFLVVGVYLTGLYHYIFCAEFINTYVAL